MDVNRNNFWVKLPDLLQTISLSEAVSIDLEMSGIVKKQTEDRENPTLQQKYNDAKQAAETFAILQVGLTCMLWEEKEGAYVTKVFNIPLTPGFLSDDPVSDELATKVEREICFSTKTMAFLQAHNFDLANVFTWGVPYLSAAEANDIAGTAFLERKSEVEVHIDIAKCPQETQRFYKTMESKIQTWISARMFEEGAPKVLRLDNPYEGRFHRFQKRLVHQLVETRFSEHRAYSRNGSQYMEVIRRNPQADTENHGHTLNRRTKAVARQTGFRHIWDALCGGNFAAAVDPELVVGTDPLLAIALHRVLLTCEERLHARRPIIVGHNMLWDLCFLFKTFQGRLPDSVDEFQKLVNDKMPKIVDTKYLFTRGGHEMMPDQSLDECHSAVQNEMAPQVKLSPLYHYHKQAPHEAGYDSEFVPSFAAHMSSRGPHTDQRPHPRVYPGYMTAIVFLKKSHQLARDKHGLGVVPCEDPGEPWVNRFARRVPGHGIPATASWTALRTRGGFSPSGSFSPSDSDSLLDSLLDADDDDDSSLAELMARFQPLKPTIATSVSSPAVSGTMRDVAVSMESAQLEEDTSEQQQKNNVPVKIPDWEDGLFWKRYGNRIRVGQSGLMMYTGQT